MVITTKANEIFGYSIGIVFVVDKFTTFAVLGIQINSIFATHSASLSTAYGECAFAKLLSDFDKVNYLFLLNLLLDVSFESFFDLHLFLNMEGLKGESDRST